MFILWHFALKTYAAARLRAKERGGASCVLFLIGLMVAPGLAYGQGRGLIRDAETEQLLRDYSRPIFNAAGLGSQRVRIHLVGSRAFNAFVVDGQNMFINVGTLMNAKTPNQVIGVIAHEAGHIAGGHLTRLRQQIKAAQSASLMLQLLGIAVAAAGAVTGAGNDVGQVGAAVASGGQSITERAVLSYRRNQESQADQAAIRYLNATGQSGAGMLETFQFFADQSLASLKYVDPYVQSHPMPQQRIAQLGNLVRRSPYVDKMDSPKLQYRHDLMRAKLSGFLDNPRTVLRRYPESDKSIPALYARSIARYRDSGLKAALPDIQSLIASDRKNPYYHELKGQFLLEKGRPHEAIFPLRRAVKLAPNEPLISILLAQALLASGQDKVINEAITHLRKAIVREKTSPNSYRLLADAYGRKGQKAEAQLSSAHRYFYEGQLKLAKQQAKRAQKHFSRGTAKWIQADDILSFKKPHN